MLIVIRRADVEAFRVVQDSDRLHNVRIVRQRLPHPHKDDIGNPVRTGGRRRLRQRDTVDSFPAIRRRPGDGGGTWSGSLVGQQHVQAEDLLHNLGGRQVSLHAG